MSVAIFILVTVGHGFVRIAGAGGRQRHEHHAGNAGIEPAVVAAADFSVRRDVAASLAAGSGAACRECFCRPRTWSRVCSGQFIFASPIAIMCWMWRAVLFGRLTTFFVSAQLFRWEPESKIPRQSENLGRRDGYSLPCSWDLRKSHRPAVAESQAACTCGGDSGDARRLQQNRTARNTSG